MAVIKEKIPITYFEKLKPAIDMLYPFFFKGTVPDIQRIRSESEKNRDYTKYNKKELMEYRDSLYVMKDIIEDCHRDSLDSLTLAKDFIAEKADNEMSNIKGKEADDLMDIFWLSDSPHAYDKELKLTSISGFSMDKSDRLLWMFHRFNKYGKKTFRIEEQLTQELFLTDVTNVDSSFLQMPFPCISFYLPYNDKLTIKKQLIRYVYISERVVIGTEPATRILEFIYISDKERISHQKFEIKEGKLIEQIEEEIHSLFESNLAIRETKEIAAFILATLLYANSSEVSKQNVFPLVFQKKQDSAYPVCSLGYGIKIDKTLHYSKNPEREGLGKSMNVLKWTVRGHFRTYRKGEHWKEDKTIWIRPFLKGREKDNPDQVMKPTNYTIQ